MSLGKAGEDQTKKVRVLSVDDDDLNQVFIKEVLGGIYEVLPVMDGEKALEVVNQFKPDIILLDVMMPGINGYDVCRAIRHTPNHDRVKIIFTSAKTRPKEREEGYTAGGNDYITKPFSYDELLGKINIFSQMQLIEDEKAAYAKENAILKNHVNLLQFLNHARRQYNASEEMADFAKKLLHEFATAFEVEAALFLTSHKSEEGARFAIAKRGSEFIENMDASKLNVTSGELAEILMSYKPLIFNGLSASPQALGFPDALSELHSLLGISFLVDEDVKGGLFLINNKNKQSFSDDGLALMESLIVEVEHVFRCQ